MTAATLEELQKLWPAFFICSGSDGKTEASEEEKHPSRMLQETRACERMRFGRRGWSRTSAADLGGGGSEQEPSQSDRFGVTSRQMLPPL